MTLKAVKVAEVIALVEEDPYPWTKAAMAEIMDAIDQVRWPPGGADFAIYPESGKKSQQGNGVVPIRTAFVAALVDKGWEEEAPFPIHVSERDSSRFGKMDAAKLFSDGPPVIVEWETGNISSSHRAMNKMGIGLIEGALSAGVLIVPSTLLKDYLTDRIGNVRELRPYFPLWKNLQIDRGCLTVIVIEHDRTDLSVERIRKGTDGRALR